RLALPAHAGKLTRLQAHPTGPGHLPEPHRQREPLRPPAGPTGPATALASPGQGYRPGHAHAGSCHAECRAARLKAEFTPIVHAAPKVIRFFYQPNGRNEKMAQVTAIVDMAF